MKRTPSVALGPLLANPLFAGCSRRELRRVDRFGARAVVQPGRVLYRLGEHPHELVVILAGYAVSIGTDDAMESLGPGACVGALAPHPRDSSALAVIATTDGLVLALTGPELGGMLDACPGLSSRLVFAEPESEGFVHIAERCRHIPR